MTESKCTSYQALVINVYLVVVSSFPYTCSNAVRNNVPRTKRMLGPDKYGRWTNVDQHRVVQASIGSEMQADLFMFFENSMHLSDVAQAL